MLIGGIFAPLILPELVVGLPIIDLGGGSPYCWALLFSSLWIALAAEIGAVLPSFFFPYLSDCDSLVSSL